MKPIQNNCINSFCKQQPNLFISAQNQNSNILNTLKRHPSIRKTQPTQKSDKGKDFRLPSLSTSTERSEQENSKILKEGYAEKKIDGVFSNWKKEFFVLTSEKLYMYENKEKEKCVGCINLKYLKTRISSQKIKISFDFYQECQKLVLKFADKNLCQEWRQLFKEVVTSHLNEKKLMFKTFAKEVYEQKNYMSEKQFVEVAETGDILLFKTKNTGAQLQRFFTNSDFDHVAMIAKINGSIMVFESNFSFGVSMFEWSQYIRFFNLYERVTFRKLILNQKQAQQICPTLVKFVKKNIGRKYDLSIKKMLQFQSDFNWEEVHDERGYFCSELVAKAYKSAALLNEKKSSGRYWPVDFSDKKELQIKEGRLANEVTILLQKHLKKKV